MRRVLVYTPDLLFFSQVKGTCDVNSWESVHLTKPELPSDGVDGDLLVVDATRDTDHAWQLLDAAREASPWLVLVAYQHVHPDVGEEALRRGATEAVRRGALLARLAERLGKPPPNRAPFVGEPPR